MKIRFSLRALFFAVACVAIAIAVPYWIPKRQVLTLNEAYVGYYRGLGQTNGRGYFGRNWFRVVVHEDIDGYWEVSVDGLGYNEYRGYYGNGQLREEGLCMVIENGPGGYDIAPMRHDLLNAKFYDPNGQLISEVQNKTGKQILCHANGQRFWELDLLDGKYEHAKMWDINGQLTHESEYRIGEQHGVSVGYYPSGQLKYRGAYARGRKTGKWVWFTEDGKLDSETDYGQQGL